MKKMLFTISIVLLTPALFSQNNTSSKYDLRLASGNYPVTENLGSLADKAPAPGQSFGEKYFYYVQFLKIPSEKTKEELRSLGLDLMLYLPGYTYMAGISESFNFSLLSQYGVRSLIDIKPEFKMSSLLKKKEYPANALKENNTIEINIDYYSCLNGEQVKKEIEKKYPVLYHDYRAHIIRLRLPLAELGVFISSPFVSYAETIDPPGEPENNGGRTNHRSNTLSTDFPMGRQFNGAGVNVMLQDDGIIGPHIDYTGRIGNQFLSNNSGDHGDHCAGIIMGGGNRNPLARGMGWGATIYTYGASPAYPGFDSIYTHYNTLGIYITSTSYSNNCNAGYTTLAQKLDQQIRQMPFLIHVFSAGNNGTMDCAYGAGPGWGNITGGHKMAKNVIAVGNLDSLDVLAGSSSRGPGTDGRIKPEVCAVGTNVYSTVNVDSYAFKSGTSMACPGVSGMISQLYQAYRVMNGNTNPNSALIKAIVLNSADDMGNSGPDYKFGFGRVNGYKAVQYLEQNRYITSVVSQGNVNTHTITIPPNTQRVKIMLYWHDYEAAVNASPALVNNLDLLVTDPLSISFKPWILDPTPNALNLNANATRGTDTLNNVEQVTIDNPAAGVYTIKVAGTIVPMGPQPYYLVYEFLDDNITVTYPMGGESFVPSGAESIRWDAYGSTGTFNVEFSSDSGATWTLIAANINASQRYFNWTPFNALSGKCLVKVSRGSTSDVSDAAFSIIGVPTGIQISWACPDSLNLTWNPVTGATGYEIFRLGNMYMDSIGTSSTNSFVVRNIQSANTYWFSVRALGPLNAKGRRAIAVKKSPGVFGCNTGFDEFASAAQIAIYPNPGNGSFYVSMKDVTNSSVGISVHDMLGREIFSKRINTVQSSLLTEINIGSSASGIYFLTLADGTKKYRLRLIKE